MLCLACAAPESPLCWACASQLHAATPRVSHGLMVHSAFAHTGAGVRLVHNLKYRRSMSAGALLAAEMARRVPAGTKLLVPVPRVLVRKIAYGIDQTAVLARMVGEHLDLPVVDALSAGVWQRRLAGVSRTRRHRPRFRATATVRGAVIIDDVLTTGTTLGVTADTLGRSNVVAAVTATSARHSQRAEVRSQNGQD